MLATPAVASTAAFLRGMPPMIWNYVFFVSAGRLRYKVSVATKLVPPDKPPEAPLRSTMQKTAAIATLAALTGADAFMAIGPMGLRASPAPAISRAKIGGLKMQATDEVRAPFPLPAVLALKALALKRRLEAGYSIAYRPWLQQDLFRVVLSGRGREHAKDGRGRKHPHRRQR